MLKNPVESIESEDEVSPTSELDNNMEQLSESRDTRPESINESNDSEDEASSPSELHREMEELPERESQQQPEEEGAEQETGLSKPLVEQTEVSRLDGFDDLSESWKLPKVPWYFDPEETFRRAERDRRLRQRAKEEKKRILHHAKWQKVARAWQRVLLCGVWILGALLPLPPVLSLTDKNSEDADKTSCRNKMITPQAEVVYVAVAISAQLVVLVFYLKLVRGVRKVQMSDRKKQKINRLFTRILAVSLIDFLPLFARLVAVAAHFTCSETLSQVSRNLTSIECLYFLNHCLNPLLYFFASRHQLRDREKKRKLFLMALNDSS